MKELTTQPTQDKLCPGIQDGYALLELARGWLKQGNPVVALELLRHGISSGEADRDRELRASLLKETGRAHMMQSDWENSESCFLEAQRVFLSLEHFKGAAECARNRANMCFQNGRYTDADALCQDALEWASAINDYELRATILNTMAALAAANGDLREAIKTFQLCLADFRSAGNAIRQGYVHLNIGLTQTDIGEYRRAVESLNSALAVALEEKDLNLVEICYQNIAKCYLAQKETVLARSVLETARKILPGLNSKALENELNVLECRILRAMGDLDSAETRLRETYDRTVRDNMPALMADVLREQALVAKDRGDIDLAIVKFEAAANQYRQIGVDKGLRECIQMIKHLRGRPHE